MQTQWAQRLCQKDKERYHVDLHSAIDKKYQSIKIEKQGNSIMFSPYDLFSKEAEQEWADARLEFANKNKSAIAKLTKQLKSIEADIEKSNEARKNLQNANYENSSNSTQAWKVPAKKLDIHKYLTGNGGMSRAKVMKSLSKFKTDAEKQAEINRINALYKQYAAMANEAMKNARAKRTTLSSTDSELIDNYNKLVPQVNNARRELELLSANLYNFRDYKVEADKQYA